QEKSTLLSCRLWFKTGPSSSAIEAASTRLASTHLHQAGCVATWPPRHGQWHASDSGPDGLGKCAGAYPTTRTEVEVCRAYRELFSPGGTHRSWDVPGKRPAQGIVLGEIEIAAGIAGISNFVGFDQRTGLEA